jgi:hypothetical protein
MSSGQPQLMTQAIRQRRARLGINADLLSVDFKQCGHEQRRWLELSFRVCVARAW